MEEVTCDLQYSGVAGVFLASAVAGTLAIVVLVPFPDAVRAVLFAWIVGGATCASARMRRVRGLRIGCDGTIEVRDHDGVRAGKLAPGSFVAPWLTIIRWRPEGARLSRTLLLLPGMGGNDAMRNIRVILKWA